jgi:RsiW-degrading membrane proteinase PrsW (M82 family)
MVRLLILLAAITPPLIILSYGIAKARGTWRAEATWNAFLVGAVSAIAAIGCELALDYLLALDRMGPLAGSAAKAVLVAGIPEESIKFFVLVSLAEKHVDVRRLQDILVLALAVSLGFATFENFFYVTSVGGWKMTAALRAITAVPGHGIDGLAMGALLVAARLNGNKTFQGTKYALLVPILLHAAYDFPLFAIQKNVDKFWCAAAWLVIIAASSIFVITLCNRIIPRAVAADRAAGRDGTSIETTDRLIVGGMIAIVGGPLLAASAFYAKGFELATSVATVLGIFPVALGIDSVLTGLRRRKIRLAARRPNLDYAQ